MNDFFIIYFDRVGLGAELNPALQTWTLSTPRYATKFPTHDQAEAAIPRVIADCDVWHLTATDLRVLAREGGR